jgi:hypothetical protein
MSSSEMVVREIWLKVDRFQHTLYRHVEMGAFLKFQQNPVIINSFTTIYTYRTDVYFKISSQTRGRRSLKL